VILPPLGERGEVQRLLFRAHEAVAGHEGEQTALAIHRHEADGKTLESAASQLWPPSRLI
jgi:hypothetical protein